jgi:hypothetical protein
MARQRFEADERWNNNRRRIKPHFKVHHSIQNHPRTTAVYADNDLLAMWLRIGIAASERGAAHTGDVLYFSIYDLLRFAGLREGEPERSFKASSSVGRDRLQRLSSLLGWLVDPPSRGHPGRLTFRNLAKKQGITTRGRRRLRVITRGSSLPYPLTSTPISPNGTPDRFADFWLAYPRRVKKAQTLALWRKLKPDAELAEHIIADVRWRAANDPQWTRDAGKFIPHPPTYLNGERWMDERKPSGSANGGFVG